MSENPLQKSIYANFNLKETDELIEIWQENDRHTFSDLTFEIIQQILQERGIAIPPQNDAHFKTESDEEEINTEKQLSSNNQPIFYKPQELLFFADATAKTAWVILIVSILIGAWYFFSNLYIYLEQPATMISGIISFFSKILEGVLAFFMMKGISYGLHLLMEFEFNSRGEK